MARSSSTVKTWKMRVIWLLLILVGINGGSLIAGKYWSAQESETRWYTKSSSRRLLSNVEWERCDYEIGHARNYSAQPEEWYTPTSAYGWVVAYILAILVVFVALAIVCDDFFVPSLEVISERLDLSEDVAGATFMAAGSSAPELFTSVAGVTVESDVGVGTIVGSAVFNLLGIIALSAAFAGASLHLDWRPLARDSMFYGLSIICFILFAWDTKFKLWESVVMILLYASYIVLMKFNPQLMDLLAKLGKKSIHPRDSGNPAASYLDKDEASKGQKNINLDMKADSQDSVTFAAVKATIGTPELHEHRHFSHVKKGQIAAIAHGMGDAETPQLCHKVSKPAITRSMTEAEIENAIGGSSQTDDLAGHKKLPPIDSKNEAVTSSTDSGKSPDPLFNYKENNCQTHAEDEDNDASVAICPCLPPVVVKIPSKPNSKYCCLRWTRMSLSWILFLVSMPFIILFTWTIPNCSKPKLQRYYLVSFTMSIVWIALLSFAMVTLVGRCGCILGVDRFTMGLVIVAIGTSVPDALSSIIVARDGYGDMAVSNAIGSNVFDIDLGLGLPFLISSLIRNMEPVKLLSNRDQKLYDSGRIQIIPHVKFGFILLFILLITLIVFVLTRFRLNKVLGVCLVLLYIGFVIYSYFQDIHCNHSC